MLVFSRARTEEERKLSHWLHVANTGPAVGVSVEAIKEFFASRGLGEGDIDVLLPEDSKKSFVRVGFGTPERASLALSIARKEKLCGRSIYAALSLVAIKHQGDSIRADMQRIAAADPAGVVRGPPGVVLVQNFLSTEEEAQLVTFLHSEQEAWHNLARRRVRHFGYAFLYDTRGVNISCPIEGIPYPLHYVLERLKGLCPTMRDSAGDKICRNCGACAPDQVTVNEYPAGVGISPHIDTHSAFEDCILSLSLCSSAVCEFRSPPGSPVHGRYPAIFLPRRSVLLISEDARYFWQHYIPHRKWDLVHVHGSSLPERVYRDDIRMSLTFRKVRTSNCQCRSMLCS